jgi:hypothetical protein
MALPRRWLIFVLFAIMHLYSFPYFGALRHANELPRVLTTQQLVHRGTFKLDARLDELGSKADIATTPDGRHYQNKSPGLSILGTIVYAPLALVYYVVGARRPSLLVTTWLLRVVVVTGPAVAFLAIFRRFAETFAGDDILARDAALLAYGLGSLAFSYALLFMSHVPATVAVGIAFVLASALTRGQARSVRRSALAIGLLLGVAMFIEYQAIFAAVFIGLFVVIRGPQRWRALSAMAMGALPWLAVLAAYHWACFGSPLRTGYAYSVDAANRVGFLGIVGPSSTAASQLLAYGNNGLFVLSPWVLLGFVGAYAIARDPDARKRVGAEAVVALGIAVTYLLFVASLEPEFGRAGWSVGPRYLAIAVPFLAWLAGAGVAMCAEYTALLVPALATVLVGIVINVIAATTYPHWPTDFVNPLYEVSLRLLDEGRAPRSFGTVLGFRGVASVAPLYLGVAWFSIALLRRAGARRAHLAIAAVLTFLAVYRLHDFAKTKEPVAKTTWGLVVSTYEP